MAEARFIEDLSVGAKRFWLLQPLEGYSYIIIAPEPSSGHTSVYAATDHGDIADIKDDNGEPLALNRFEGEVDPTEALRRLGYDLVLNESVTGIDEASEEEETAA
ncbi:MAG: hypothetical protein WD645_03270 [Dehalococcoidia bacterium]